MCDEMVIKVQEYTTTAKTNFYGGSVEWHTYFKSILRSVTKAEFIPPLSLPGPSGSFSGSFSGCLLSGSICSGWFWFWSCSTELRIGGMSAWSSSCFSTACTMGTIMAVVAVLLIHMDRKAVTPMKPSIRLYTQQDRTHPHVSLEQDRIFI